MVRILGKFNDIHESVTFGKNTVVANFCVILEGTKIGDNCKIGNFNEINKNCKIGNNNLINPFCVFNENTIVKDNIIFGANVMTADEKIMSPFTSSIKKTPCKINSGTKIGQGACLISCEIGEYSMIGAGSVVLKDVPAKEVWAGNPARKIRDVTIDEIKLSIKGLES